MSTPTYDQYEHGTMPLPNWLSTCQGTVEATIKRCGRRASFFAKHHPDADYGMYACAAHLAQVARFVHEGHDPETTVTVHVVGGDARR